MAAATALFLALFLLLPSGRPVAAASSSRGRAASAAGAAFLPPSRRSPPSCRRPPPPSSPPPRSASSSGLGSTLSSRGYEPLICVDEDCPRDVPSFEAWAHRSGIQRSEGFRLAYSDDGIDVYAATDRDAPAGTCVLCVPEHLILSASKAMSELRTREMDPAEKILRSVNAEDELPRWYLMIQILAEYEKGEESAWFPWLNSLPRYYTNAASMTPFCCLCLPSLMRKLAVKERGTMSKLSVGSIKLIPFLNDDTKYDVDLCNWAYQVVYTRSFETETTTVGSPRTNHVDPFVCSSVQMFNHGSDYTEIEPSYDEQGNYYAYTTYDVPAGSPLRIQYADPTNPSFLFARYGFLDTNTPATFCKLMPEHVNKDMEELGYDHSRMLFYNTGDVSEEVWDVLLYQHLASTNIRDRRMLMEAHRTGDWETKQGLHERYYPDTSRLLLEHIDGFIEQLDKLSAKAEERARNIGDHPRLPLISSHNQFVRETFMTVRNRYFGY
ncbi:hypothetical protein ACHAWF_016251 [Thalassiosira exigua]